MTSDYCHNCRHVAICYDKSTKRNRVYASSVCTLSGKRCRQTKPSECHKDIVMSERDYRSYPAISRSDLWRMNESAEKFKWFMDHPLAPTPALLFGQLVHKLVLQPSAFDDEFAVAPNIDKRTKAGKESYEAFLATVGDKTVVSLDDYNKALDMAIAVRKNPLADKLLTGTIEKPFFWTDPDTGEDCKCRVDCLTEVDGEIYIVDYKSTGNAQTEIFSNKDVFRYGYHFQAAMYSEGVMRAMELDVRPRFVFIAQEKTAPYAVNVIAVPDDVMLAGIDKYRELIGRYHECKVMDYYPGYNTMGEMNEVLLPGWMSLGVEEDE